MIEPVYIVIIILLIFVVSTVLFKFGKSENFSQNTKIVLYQDYRNEDPSYIYDSPKKIDVMLNTNLKSAIISSGDHTVEIWRIWDSPNSNSTSINSDFYSYIVPYAMRSNPGKYELLAKIYPDKTEKIDFDRQINRIRLIVS